MIQQLHTAFLNYAFDILVYANRKVRVSPYRCIITFGNKLALSLALQSEHLVLQKRQ